MAISEPWWQPRRSGQRTFEYLERVLNQLGAYELAKNAAAAHYDDFECPPELDDGMNIHRLIADLEAWSRKTNRANRLMARIVIEHAKAGEFDSTKEESDRYVASARGQADLAALTDPITPKEDV